MTSSRYSASRRHRRRRDNSRHDRSRRHDSSHRRRRRRSPSYSSSSSSSSSSDSSDAKPKQTPKKSKLPSQPKILDPSTQTPIFPLESERMTVREKMQHQSMITTNPSVTRLSRRIYIGNLPTDLGLTEPVILEFFSTILRFFGVNTPQAILSVWLSDPPAFCFLYMRSVSDTTKFLTLLDNFQVAGKTLKVARPPDYVPAPPVLQNYVVGAVPLGFNTARMIKDPAAHKARFSGPKPEQSTKKIRVPFPPVPGTRIKEELMPVKIRPTIDGGTLVAPAFKDDIEKIKEKDPTKLRASEIFTDFPPYTRKVLLSVLPKSSNISPSLLDIDILPSRPCLPSLIIKVEGMVKPEELIRDDEYTDILNDARNGAQRYGDVAAVVIPRPGMAPGEFGVGNVYIEYTRVKDAIQAHKYMPRKRFMERKLTVKYYEEYKYKAYIF